jgi:hypothetical protein
VAPGRVCLDLSEYVDAALDAVVACLQRYDATRGVSFSTYAYSRMAGAVTDAAEAYALWCIVKPYHNADKPHAEALAPLHHGLDATLTLRQRIARLPRVVQQYAHAILQGWTARELAAREGITEGRLSQRVKSWRQGREGACR